MSENGQKVRFFLELRQRLQSGLLVLRRDEVGNPAEVTVSGGASALHVQFPKGPLCLQLPPGVSVMEGSCREAQGVDRAELHFRLRLKVDQPTEAPGSVLGRLRAQETYGFRCQACGESVMKDRLFRRVLPLPNGNWGAVVGEWCCHPDPFANLALLPRLGDCLLGDTYLLLLRDATCDRTLIERPAPENTAVDPAQKARQRNATVSCQRCKSALGEAITEETLKLYITELTVTDVERQTEEDDITPRRWPFLEQTLAATLEELSCAQSIFRFCIQTPTGEPFILLWLLNTDSVVASSPWETPFCSDAPVAPEERCHRGDHRSSRAGDAVKVLYLPWAPGAHQDVKKAWEKDISVHPLTLLPGTCGEVLQLLTASTSSLPPSLRSMDSYQVAFLRRSEVNHLQKPQLRSHGPLPAFQDLKL